MTGGGGASKEPLGSGYPHKSCGGGRAPLNPVDQYVEDNPPPNGVPLEQEYRWAVGLFEALQDELTSVLLNYNQAANDMERIRCLMNKSTD